MKTRLLALLLALLLAVTLTGCGSTPASGSLSEPSGTSESSEPSESAETDAPTLLDDAAFARPDERYWMLKIANQIVGLYPQDKFDGYCQTLEKYGYAGVVGNVSWSSKYLTSDKMWGFFDEQVAWAAAQGERYWIYDEQGYPSGAAGTLVYDSNPDFETMGIARVQVAAKGGDLVEITDIPASHKALFAVAYPGTNGNDKDLAGAVDLTSCITEANSLRWTATDGQWLVELYLQKPLYEETHASSNVFADRRYINIMDKEAIAKFIEVTYDAYYAHVGDYFGTTIEAFFTDEPSLMSFNTPAYEGTKAVHPLDEDFVRYPTVAWSRDFFTEFEARMGYDITPYMTYLFGGDSEAAVRARYDYWLVVSALIEEAYYKQIGDWCDAHGVAFSGHMLCEESLVTQVMCEGNYMRNWSHQGVIGIDLLTSDPQDLMGQCLTMKLAASADRLYNKGGVMSEDSTFSDQPGGLLDLTLDEIRCGLALQYALGVTQVTSYYGYDEIAGEDAPDEEKDDTGMMLARMGYALDQGQHVADVALYYPIESAYAELLPNTLDWGSGQSMRMGEVSDSFQSSLRVMLEAQLDPDILPGDAILDSAVEDGRLVSPGGEAFSVLVVPKVTLLPSAVVEKLLALADAGVRLVLVGDSTAFRTPNGEDTDAAHALWETLRGHANVTLAGSDATVASLVREALPTPDLTLDARAALVYNHTASDTGDVYLLVNYGETGVSVSATFRATGTVRLLDPLTGETTSAEAADNGDGTATLPVELPVNGAVLVEFTRG